MKGPERKLKEQRSLFLLPDDSALKATQNALPEEDSALARDLGSSLSRPD